MTRYVSVIAMVVVAGALGVIVTLNLMDLSNYGGHPRFTADLARPIDHKGMNHVALGNDGALPPGQVPPGGTCRLPATGPCSPAATSHLQEC